MFEDFSEDAFVSEAAVQRGLEERMETGLSSYTWPWAVGREGYQPKHALNALDLVEKALKYGVSVLQLADAPHLHLMSCNELERLARKAEKHALTLEVGTRGIDPDHLLRYLDIAKQLKSRIVRTITLQIDEKAEAQIREVLPAFETANVAIALENHDEHSSKELSAFLERIGSPLVGVCLDTVNSFAALEPPETVVRQLAPYTLNLHVKDFDVVRFGHELGFSIVGRPAGRGRLDIAWIAGHLKERGRDPNAILELWTPFTDTLEKTIALEEEWTEQSITYLRSVLG
jgi:sugar phosphate isomerase/epimerase